MKPKQRLSKIFSKLLEHYFLLFVVGYRRAKRLKAYGLNKQLDAPVAQLKLHHDLGKGEPTCSAFVDAHAGYFKNHAQKSNHTSYRWPARTTLTAIDLSPYENVDQYAKIIRKQANFIWRDAQKAKKKGYSFSPFDPKDYGIEIDEIINSKPPKATQKKTLITTYQQSSYLTTSQTPSKQSKHPECNQHWESWFGIFTQPLNNSGIVSTELPRRLIAYTSLRRFGNSLAYEDFIGHAHHVNAGVMKLLHFEIMGLVLDRQTPNYQGIEFLCFGALEKANQGIFYWRKCVLFTPWLINLIQDELPSDFSIDEYLRLNPDLAAHNIDLKAHYLRHGAYEGRRYQ